MSYLKLDKGPQEDFIQAVISFWFRVPQASIDACNVAADNDGSPLDGVIPLVCFGVVGTAPPKKSGNPVVACHTYFQFEEGGAILSETDLGFTPTKVSMDVLTSDKAATIPSCIGVDCNSVEDDVISPRLFINLETGKAADFENYNYNLIGIAPATTYAGVSNPGWPPGPNIDAVYTYTNLPAQGTEHFAGSGSIKVTADHWHHVLLSFSLKDVETEGNSPASVSENTSGASQMWLAFDDKNYTEYDLSDYWPDGSDDPNAILTPNAYNIAQMAPAEGGYLYYNSTEPANYGVFRANAPPAGTASFSLHDPTILKEQPVGIPSTARFVENIHQVEMAEFMMFTGVTLDTGFEPNRRAFIAPATDDPKGTTMVPVPPVGQPASEGQPAKPAPAEGLLGKKPEILLHGSSKWIGGENTGTLGVNYNVDPPEIKPEGQFESVGQINAYTPDPSLTDTTGTSPVRLIQNARL